MARIEARARRLCDHLAAGENAEAIAGGLFPERIERWRAALAGENGAFLEERIGRRPLQAAAANTKTSRWPALLERAMARASSSSRARNRVLDKTDPLPFEEIAVPFILTARDMLRVRCAGIIDARLEPAARRDLERELLQRLVELSARAIYREFSIERSARTSELERLIAGGVPPERHLYRQFVKRTLDDSFAALFDEYPVLARTMSRASELWISATSDFLGRLSRDLRAVAIAFGDGRPLGRVARIETGLSDPHAGARTVLRLSFEAGETIAYKPKELGTEVAFNRLLAWLNELAPPMQMVTIRTLPRAGYGWAEWVEQRPCETQEQLHQFYRRAGMLLCICHILAATDCHQDNVVAAGEHPLLVDLEALMHPEPLLDPVSSVREYALRRLADGVLATGLLPEWQVADGDVAFDIGGLSGADGETAPATGMKWSDINTDRMSLARGPVNPPTFRNEASLGDERRRVDDHADELVAGFRDFYLFIERNRDRILASQAFKSLAAAKVRYIWRNTRVYGSLYDRLCEPSCLRDGMDRGIELERLAAFIGDRNLPAAEKERSLWPLVESEIEALEDGDVPVFRARARGRDLILPSGREIAGWFARSGFEKASERIRSLGAADLQLQTSFILGSLHAMRARHDGPPRPTTRGRQSSATEETSPEGVREIAFEIAEDIEAQAIWSEDGQSATWIAPRWRSGFDRYQLQPVSLDLHGGAAGIALFLAAADRLAGGGRFRRAALAALQPIRAAIAQDGAAVVEEIGLGAAAGLGSLVWTLTRLSKHLEEPALIGDARRAAALLDERRIAAAHPDLFSGLAGEILGLLALHEATRDRKAISLARACGERLLETMRPARSGGRAWITYNGRMLTGMSHGAAGIAYALARLAGATGDGRCLAAAAAAIKWEDGLFSEHELNWPDLREDRQPAFKNAWCHGAAGIGIARLGSIGVLDTPTIRRDIEAALSSAIDAGIDGPDHLCCGNLGRCEFLLLAGETLGRPELVAKARALAKAIVGRAKSEGGFLLDSFLPRRLRLPEFFMGISGIGYQALRTAHPRELPSALLWH